ncbi:hypothetical protein COP2_048044 [Malus domestica]
MATGYELLLESASEVNDLEYLIGLSSLSALSEARVITDSCLEYSYSFSRVDVGVKGTAEKAFADKDVLVLPVGCGNRLILS